MKKGTIKLSLIEMQIRDVVHLIVSNNLQEELNANYESILEELAGEYLMYGGSEEKLEELFAGLAKRGKAIIGNAASKLRTAGKIASRVGLSAALVASPVWGKKTTPAVQGSDGTPAVVQPATPDTVVPAKTVKPTGKFVISGEKDLKTGKARIDTSSPSGFKRGSDQIEIDDAGAALKHSVPGSLTHIQARDAIAAAAKQSTPSTIIPGTPAKVIKPASGARPDLPARNTWSLTAVPNMRDRDLPRGTPTVQQGDAFVGKRRRRSTTTGTSGTGTTPVTGGGGGLGGRLGGGGSDGGRRGDGFRPYPTPVEPDPVLGRIGVGTRSTNLERGGLSRTNPGRARSISGSDDNPVLRKKVAAARGEQAAWTTGLSTPVVGRQQAFGSVPTPRPRPKPRKGVLFREENEELMQIKNQYKNLLNEMLSNKSRFGERKALALHQAGRVRRMLDAHSKSMFGNPAAGSPENMAKLERLNLLARSQGADTTVRNALIAAPKDGRTTDAYPNLVPVGPGSKVNFAALGDKERIESQQKLDRIRRTGIRDRRQRAMMARHKAALDARDQEFTME